MYIVKKPLNLLVDEEVLTKARGHGLVISTRLENKLKEYFQFRDRVGKLQDHSQKDSVGLLRFERKSMARSTCGLILTFSQVPEATRIPSYPTGPKGLINQKEKTDKRVFSEINRFKDL